MRTAGPICACTRILIRCGFSSVTGRPSALPERCRQLLSLVAMVDRPDYAVVSRMLGMPVGSIGPTRGRCLAKLRLALAADPTWSIR